jgi:NlpC/P60 family putative phage cell wall peptidase
MAEASSDELRAALIAETRTWLRTPYHHQQSTKGAGCDCLGLLRGVWRAVIGPEPVAAPNYSRDWAEALGRETLLETCRAFLIEKDVPAPGDVIVFRMQRAALAKHCALLVAPDRIIHAYQGIGVTEEGLAQFLRTRRTASIAGVFAFPGA